jgi:hypothetical protein
VYRQAGSKDLSILLSTEFVVISKVGPTQKEGGEVDTREKRNDGNDRNDRNGRNGRNDNRVPRNE